jgi:chemotaxis family two-component system sensor kinase Cph1
MTALMSAFDQHVRVSCTDRAGIITFVNPAFCRSSGYTPAELLGQTHRLLRSNRHPPEFFANLWRTIARGDVWRGEMHNRAKDGSEYWVAATIAPLAAGPSLGSSYIALCTDITQRELEAQAQIERQLRELGRLHAKVARSDEELRQYAYVASHDLQEPLRAIVGCGQLLRQEFAAAISDQTARQLLDHMIEGGQRMQQLVLALLAYSRVASRASCRVFTSSQIALEQAIRELDSSIRASGATIEAHGLPNVSCDPQQIALLFQNLLENAIKYRGNERPVIRVSAALDGDSWRFSVADNGIGIDPQYSERVFVLFQRLHARGKYQGCGVGLSVCKKIVERHGGNIWVESDEGKGTTVSFTLSARESTPGDEA